MSFGSDAGVTLVEVLVSFVMLGLLSGLLLISLQQISRVMKVSEQAQSMEDINGTLDHMAKSLRSIVMINPVGKNNQQIAAFNGEPNEMRFYTLSDGTILTGGIYQLRWIVSGENSDKLTEEMMIIANMAPNFQYQNISRQLVKKLENVKFRYLSNVTYNSHGDWVDSWKSNRNIPSAVEITLSILEGQLDRNYSRVVLLPVQ